MTKKTAVRKVEMPDAKKLDEKKRCGVTGSKHEDFINTLLNQAINTMWVAHSNSEEANKQINAVLVGMMGVNPQDEVEGMLAAQMVALHNASMECFRRTMIQEQSFNSRAMNLNHGSKLSRTYAMMMEALSRYRGKGQQKMTVEHVHVYEGGQAIVGNVTHPQGGGVKIKKEEQPHAKQNENAPMPEMPCQNPQGQPVPIPRNA